MASQTMCKWNGTIGSRCICTDPTELARITRHRAKLLTLIADYLANPDIATILGITTGTVKREVEELRCLTGCRSKRALARWWADHRDIWKTAAQRL